jgi:hypothetical protein
MKYSLRSLMIVVTLAAGVAAYAGNAIQCQKKATFHEREAAVISERLCNTRPPAYVYPDLKSRGRDHDLAWHHFDLAEAYRKAAWQPWLIVGETPAP